MSDEVTALAKQLLRDIQRAFPEVSALWSDVPRELPLDRLERFARLTDQALLADTVCAQAYLQFMEARLQQGSTALQELIDVAYAEPLLFYVPVAKRRTAFKQLPARLASLHRRCWPSRYD